jgi:outer membrane receptor for ferrienterochelin and colicins
MRTLQHGFSLGLALIWVAASARAEDTGELEGLLDTAVVSAPSKAPEAATLAPATSIVLTAEDFRRYGIRSLDDAINFLGRGMLVEKTLETGEIGARGVMLTSDFGSHVLLMVDGHVLNEAWSATAYFDRTATIPFEIIDHIELVLGPGSVLYGSSAMLGIVHIVTKRAKDYEGVHFHVDGQASLLAPGRALRGAAGFGKAFSLGETRGEVVFEGEYYTQDGPTFDFGPQDWGPDSFSSYRHFDVDPKDRKYPFGIWGGRGDDAYYTRAPAGLLKLRLGDFELMTRAALSKRAEPTDSGNFDDPNSYQIDRFLNLDLKHTLTASSVVRLSTRLYGDLYDYNQYWTSNGHDGCLDGQGSGCLWRLFGAASWVGLEPQLTLDWLEDARLVTLLGMDGRLKHITSRVHYHDNATGKSPGAVGAYAELEKALAAYVQQTFWVTPAFGLNAGARLDLDERFGAAALPRASAVVVPWRGGTLKAIYSEAFRAPTAFDIYYNDPTTQVPGGKSLKPERVRSVEVSMEQHAGSHTLEVSAYYSKWRDLLLGADLSDEAIAAAIARGELVENPDEEPIQVQNVSRITSYGMDLGYRGSMFSRRLGYAVGLTGAVARREEPGGQRERLAVMPHAFANARVSYDLGGALPTLALAGRFVPRRPLENYPDDTREFAIPFGEIRAVVSGPIAGTGFSYSLSGNFITAKTTAYVVGGEPLPNGEAEKSPNDQLRIGAGLSYDLPL